MRVGVVVMILGLGVLLASALLADPVAADASFGVVPGSFQVSARNRDGTIDRMAGSHPYVLTVAATFSHDHEGDAEGSVRDVRVDLPPGLVGNPLATPRCTREAFDVAPAAECPGDTQIGTFHADLRNPHEALAPAGALYNLVPPKGVAASFGFSGAGLVVIENASVVRHDGVYTVAVTTNNVSHEDLVNFEESVWGVPADGGHDPERECVNSEGDKILGCASGSVAAPFLTLPGACGKTPMRTVLEADSVEAPGVFVEATAESEEDGTPVGLVGCEELGFSPSIGAAPETTAAASASGLDVDVHVPQPESTEGLAEADVNETVVTLPQGMAVNPTSAEGLASCSSAQIGLESDAAPECPSASNIGTVTVITPLVDHPLPGTVYLAAQGDNPFDSLLAIYIVVDDPETGTIVKLPAHVEANPITGQLTTTVANLPQFPFEDVKVDLTGGPRAALLTPETCGTKTTTALLKPWTAPEGYDVTPQSSFAITTGPFGSGCASTAAEEPDTPAFTAGTTFPAAGAFSPFELRLSREQGSQQFLKLQTTLPPGLIGKIAGIPRCSDSQIAAAEQAGRTGREEIASPSCPAASEIGTVTVAAGAGEHPFQVQGHVYLAGPYDGGPFSLAVITPAVAGPFDLGTVVVRAALDINPQTAQVTVVSDPFPTILQGIPLDVRSILVDVDHREFTFNPTNCAAQSILGTLTSSLGSSAGLSSPFQPRDCELLPFSPGFKVTTSGRTSRADGASLNVRISQKPGEANIHEALLQLPRALPSRLETLHKACTEAQFAANRFGCPEASVIGTGTAITPVLATPLSGPAYLVSHGGAEFPDVVFVLEGEGVVIELDGHTQIKKGITYSRFETVPDAPVSSFEANFPERRFSVLGAVGDLCQQALVMPTTLIGQNGVERNEKLSVDVTGCPRPSVHVKKTRVRKSSVVLTLSLSEPGTVTISGSGLKSKSVTLAGGTHAVTVKRVGSAGGTRSVKVRVSLKGPRGSAHSAARLRL